ncbi:MAG: type II secretion system minor pseudopilin GspI [Rubripirellula sp.]
MSSNSRPARRRNGFTLLEVLISISLMVVALTGINQLIANGERSLRNCRDRTTALQICQSKMALLLAGGMPVGNRGVIQSCNTPHLEWTWRWTVSKTDDQGLANLSVEVMPGSKAGRQMPSVLLARMIVTKRYPRIERELTGKRF